MTVLREVLDVLRDLAADVRSDLLGPGACVSRWVATILIGGIVITGAMSIGYLAIATVNMARVLCGC